MAESDWVDVESSESDWVDVEEPTFKESGNSSSMISGGIGAAAVGGLGYIAKKTIIDPLATAHKADNQLKAIGQIFNINPKVSPDFIPQALKDRINDINSNSKLLLNNIKNQSNFKVNEIGKQISGINEQAISSSAELANIIKANAPDVYKKTMDNFKNGLDAVDKLAEERGFSLSNKQFTSNVLDVVIEDAKTSGIDSKTIKQISDARDAILEQSKILNVKGNSIGTNISLSDAKSVISNLTREEPYSPMSAKIRETWASFLEKESPPEVKPLYEKLNATYKPFAEARTFISKLSDPKTGIVDYGGIAKHIEDYVKKGQNTGIEELMKLLGEGNELVPKIDGLSNRFGVVKGLKETKPLLLKMLSDAKASGAINLSAQQQKDMLDILNLQKAKTEANILVNISNTARSKLPIVGSFLKAGAKLSGKLAVGLPFGSVSNEIDKQALGYDPSDAFGKVLGSMFGSPEKKKKILKDAEDAAMKELEI